MNKGKWVIGIIAIIVVCAGCFLAGRYLCGKTTLIVEDGIVKYNNGGKYDEIISLEKLFTNEENTSVVNGKEVEFSIQDGYIVWNYVGETNTNKLISVEELVGKQGIAGTNGKDGTDGVDGKDGADGVNGINGVDGIDGVDGTNGINGVNGIDGKNAYIWIKYLDNEPTSSSDSDLKDETGSYMGIYYGELSTAPTNISSYKWYEIKGKKGQKGETGATGAQGIQGEKGEKGDKGDKGDTGAKGETGTNGKDGSISEMMVFEGLITSSATGTQISLVPDTILYKNGESIYIDNLTKNVKLESGTYLITIDGYGVFNTTNTSLNFVVEHEVNKYIYPAKLPQDSNILCNFSFTKCCIVGESDLSKQIRLYVETNTTSLNSIKYTVSIMKLI